MNKLRISIIKIQTKINSRLMLKKNISKRKLREYGFFIGIVFPFFIGWLIPFLLNDSFKIWTLFISIPHILLAIFLPIQFTLFYTNITTGIIMKIIKNKKFTYLI